MKTFAVIGMGKFGISAAKKLAELGCEVIAIDSDGDKVNEVADYVTKAAQLDAKNKELLRNIGIKNCECAIVAIGDNVMDCVFITLTLKEMGVKKVVCKARDSQHETVLKKVGADMVIIPEQEAGEKMASRLVSRQFIDILHISDEYSIEDMRVPAKWIGKSLADLSVRKKFGVNIVAIKNSLNPNDVNITPEPEYRFKDTDIVVLVGKTQDINKLNK
ncbi:MAG: TrkA family potassium uptake protein [Clostridia bacterium]|nr:TrkA family potassium uptake protein [Clostridia bacterium]